MTTFPAVSASSAICFCIIFVLTILTRKIYKIFVVESKKLNVKNSVFFIINFHSHNLGYKVLFYLCYNTLNFIFLTFNSQLFGNGEAHTTVIIGLRLSSLHPRKFRIYTLLFLLFHKLLRFVCSRRKLQRKLREWISEDENWLSWHPELKNHTEGK